MNKSRPQDREVIRNGPVSGSRSNSISADERADGVQAARTHEFQERVAFAARQRLGIAEKEFGAPPSDSSPSNVNTTASPLQEGEGSRTTMLLLLGGAALLVWWML